MENLWITEPRRATCLAEVTQVSGDWFTVDRALFAPTSKACRHPQPADKGTVWRDGEKRRLATVRADGWYRLRDAVPAVGEKLQCELDQEWRDDLSRAHTAMHLMLAACDAPVIEDPEVKGGGHARLVFGETIAPKRLATWLERANQWVEADIPVEVHYAPRAEVEHAATAQRFQPPDPIPGPDPSPLVAIDKVCTYPCDGTHADRTGRIGRIVVSHAAWGQGFVVGIKVVPS